MKKWAIAAAVAAFGCSPAFAVTYFNGMDVGAGAGAAAPVSLAARNSFMTAASALGTVNLIDFESVSLGRFTTSRSIGAGVTASFTNVNDDGGIVAAPQSVITGYNTTSGGSRYLEFDPITASNVSSASTAFTFVTPIDAFGAYLTGVGTSTGTLSVLFNDGTSDTQAITGNDNGGRTFFGFTDPGKSIASVSFQLANARGNLNDQIGFDDILYVSSGVPEPAGWAMMVGGFGLIGATLRRRRTALRLA